MADGTRTTDFTLASILDEVVGNLNGETVRAPVASLASQLSTSRALSFASWTELAAVTTGNTVGQLAYVVGDSGTHTDPVTGTAGRSNSGTFTWATTPATGWKWVSNTSPLEVNADDARIMREVVDADLADLAEEVYGTTTPNSATAANTNIWGLIDQVKHDGFLQSASIRVAASGSGMFVIVDSSGKILSEHSKVVASSGVNSFTFENAFMPAGARLFWRPTSGADLRYQSGGATASFTATGYPGVGTRVSISLVSNVLIAIEFTVEYILDGAISVAAYGSLRRSKDIAAKYELETRTSQPSTSNWPAGAPSISKKAVAFDAGTDVPVGALVTGVYDELIAPSGLDRFLVQILSRDTSSGSIESAPILTEDVLIWSGRFTVAEAGLVSAASEIALATFDVAPFFTESGKTYFIVVTAFDADGIQVNMANGNVACTESRQRRRGFYGTTGAYASVSAGFMHTLGLRVQRKRPAALRGETPFERFDDVSFSTSTLDLKTTAIIDRNGRSFGIGESRTLTAAASGLIRYDTLYFDTVARAFGVAAGGEHATDAPETLAALSSSKYLPICNIRVSDTAITDVVPTWRVNRAGEPYDLVEALETERRRSRSCLKKTLGKARRGAAIKIVSMGDSIVAIESTTTGGGLTTPNGSNRDRGRSYLAANLSSSVTDTLPLYTSVQLGRADDGAGSVHTKWGMVWDLVAALETGGSTVIYDNFCWGGKATADAMSGGSAGTWVTNVIALFPDLVIIHFGMNEPGNTSTEANLVVIAQALKAAGIEVIMMGVPRRNNQSTASLATAEYTNRAISRAAKYTDSGHVPTWAFFDERYLGAVGISKLDTGTANAINHPGIVEQAAIGRELVKIFL
jgi:hypothetical protein